MDEKSRKLLKDLLSHYYKKEDLHISELYFEKQIKDVLDSENEKFECNYITREFIDHIGYDSDLTDALMEEIADYMCNEIDCNIIGQTDALYEALDYFEIKKK